ncbi:Uncharacterised protein [Mycobacterium tuberculosis]|nr:Uncharacterised protein [Mycobacterium tuberculosis]
MAPWVIGTSVTKAVFSCAMAAASIVASGCWARIASAMRLKVSSISSGP